MSKLDLPPRPTLMDSDVDDIKRLRDQNLASLQALREKLAKYRSRYTTQTGKTEP